MTAAAPFVKWAGGKRAILDDLLPTFPREFRRYHEPFVGGGAVFFRLSPAGATVADANAELVTAYRVIRDDVEGLVAWLAEQPYSETHFKALRAQATEQLGDLARAGRFIYLNRTCFNGLYRVNRAGRFNVAFGKYANPTICDAEGLRAAARALAGVTVRCQPYEMTTAKAAPGDFVYFDPPYDKDEDGKGFTSYTAGAFGRAEQEKLATEFRRLDALGAKLVLSNADTPLVRELFRGFEVVTIRARRSISCRAETRGDAGEVIVRNQRLGEAW